MKKPVHVGVLLGACLMSACGQPGPLYLPGTKPPFYVPTEPEPEKTKASEQDKTNGTDQDQSSESPPVPEKQEPAKEQ